LKNSVASVVTLWHMQLVKGFHCSNMNCPHTSSPKFIHHSRFGASHRILKLTSWA